MTGIEIIGDLARGDFGSAAANTALAVLPIAGGWMDDLGGLRYAPDDPPGGGGELSGNSGLQGTQHVDQTINIPGPGQWGTSRIPIRSADAARYQTQITGRPSNEVYYVPLSTRSTGRVEFDGFRDGFLVEAKDHYSHLLTRDGNWRQWSYSAREAMIDQARDQISAAGGTPIRWYFSEREVADAVRQLFDDESINIEVIYEPHNW